MQNPDFFGFSRGCHFSLDFSLSPTLTIDLKINYKRKKRQRAELRILLLFWRMTLVDQVSSKMAASVPSSGTRNALSFSISRLLEGNEDEPERPKDCESVAESTPEEGRETPDNSDSDEDVKVHDSEDDEELMAAAERRRSGKIPAEEEDYPRYPAPSIGLDWYTFYALQQQQQQQQQHPLTSTMFPAHMIHSGYLRASHHPSSGSTPSSGSYLSFLNGNLAAGSSAAYPPPPPPQMHVQGLSSASGGSRSPSSQQHMPAGMSHNSGAIPSAFAALLEATVFKDRIAAGN